MLKQNVELIGKAIKLKEIQTQKGWIYSFSIPITDMDGEQQLTQWLNCSIFLKEKDQHIMQHTGEFHIVGKLVVKKAWGDYPQSLGLFGFEITPVLGKVYKQGNPQQEEGSQDQAKEQVPQSLNVTQQEPQHRHSVPATQEPPQDLQVAPSEIPF